MGKPTISVCATIYGKTWLLEKAVHWWRKLDWDRDDIEFVIIDDNSPIPLDKYLDPLRDDGFKVVCKRNDHSQGWRGIVRGLTQAFTEAQGEYILETNGHLMIPSGSLGKLHSRCSKHPWSWITLRGYLITNEAAVRIHDVDWANDVHAFLPLPESQCNWTRAWIDGDVAKQPYGTHLCCMTRKEDFFKLNPWPENYDDYGTEDPTYAAARSNEGMHQENIWEHEYYFAHLPHNSHGEDAFELQPVKLNLHGHTQKTANLWDQGEMRMKTLLEVIDYWEQGSATADWKVRSAWGHDIPQPEDYIAYAQKAIDQGKVNVADLDGFIPELHLR